MLEDIDVIESPSGVIRIKIKAGARVAYRISEELALKLFRQLGDIVAPTFAKQYRERFGHVVEGETGHRPVATEEAAETAASTPEADAGDTPAATAISGS